MKISLRAPATSANLGSGFDCLGLALDIWASVTVETDRPMSSKDNGIGRQASARRPTRRNGPSMGIELARQRIQLFDPASQPGNAVQVRDDRSEQGTASGTTVTLCFRPQPITEHAPDSHRG